MRAAEILARSEGPFYRLTGPAPSAARILSDGSAEVRASKWRFVHPAEGGEAPDASPGQVVIGLNREQAGAYWNEPGCLGMAGSEPIWDLDQWNATREDRTIRSQIRRAKAKGTSVVRLRRRADLSAWHELKAAWLAARAPGAGLTPPAMSGWLEPPRMGPNAWGAWRDGRLEAAAAVWTIRPGRILLNPILRRSGAANGTVERLIDGIFSEHCGEASLGLCLMSEQAGWPVDPWIRRAESALAGYRLAGVEAFRLKMKPDSWEPFWFHINPRFPALWKRSGLWRRWELASCRSAFAAGMLNGGLRLRP